MSEYDRVTVKAKVIEVNDTEVVGKKKQKQEVTIADTSSSIRLTLWEKDIGTLEFDKSYILNQAVVRF